MIFDYYINTYLLRIYRKAIDKLRATYQPFSATTQILATSDEQPQCLSSQLSSGPPLSQISHNRISYLFADSLHFSYNYRLIHKIIIFLMNSRPYEDHKRFYQSIQLQQRTSFLKQLLLTPQSQGDTVHHHLPYPSQSSFRFQSFILNYYFCGSSPQPSAIVVFLHGLYSYGGNSGYLGVNVAKSISGVNFYSLDFLNFGKSLGDFRGYIRSFQSLVEQGEAFVDHLLSRFGQQTKVFLVGESLGGAVAFKMGLRQPQKYKGVIFLNPALRQIKQSQYVMKKVGKLLGYLAPKLKLAQQSFTSTTKYDTEKLVKSNPFIYNDRHVPGSIRVALNAMEEIENLYSHFICPYIVFQGGVDKAVDLFAALDLEKQSKSKDKTTVYIKTMWHSVFFEQEIAEISDLVVMWLSKRI